MDTRPMNTASAAQTTGAADTSPAGERKPYTTPSLTKYGQMSKLTRLGGGDGENDGDTEYGRPLS